MIENNKLFLDTGVSQIKTAELLTEQLQASIEYITYNIKRYKTPVSMLLFYSQEDISSEIKEHMRLTDVVKTVKIGNAYFNFVFLLFTDDKSSYEFIKNIENSTLLGINNYFYYEELDSEIHNIYNFINSYLFQIDKKETFF